MIAEHGSQLVQRTEIDSTTDVRQLKNGNVQGVEAGDLLLLELHSEGVVSPFSGEHVRCLCDVGGLASVVQASFDLFDRLAGGEGLIHFDVR